MSESTPVTNPAFATTKPSESGSARPKAYAIGPDSEAVAAHLFPDFEVVVCDGMPSEPAERVLLNGVLQYMTFSAALAVLGRAAELVKPGGELHVIVPSVDWAARELIKPRPSPAATFILWGKQYQGEDLYHSGWTISHLRTYVTNAGCVVREAKALDAYWTLLGPDGREEETPVKLNYVVGVKNVPAS